MSIKQTIKEAIFSLYKQKTLEGKFSAPVFDQQQKNIVYLQILKEDSTPESLKIIFPQNYPEQPPKIQLKSEQLNNICYSSLIGQKYSKQVTLSEIIEDYYNQINRILDNQKQFLNSIKKCQKQDEERSINVRYVNKEKAFKKKIEYRHSSKAQEKQTTETKNLNRHFRSKLRDILKQLDRQKIKDYEEIQALFNSKRVGFQDIRKALSYEDFNQQLKIYMESGRFMHKILTGMMGMKSKKLMIKYYRYMVSAVHETDKFSKWKYE